MIITRIGIMLALSIIALAGMAAAQEGKLLIYTSQPNTDAQQTIDAFKSKYPGVDISFVRDGTPRIMAKLRAEIVAGQPQPDLLLVADSVTLEALKAEGRLADYPDADISTYPVGMHDPLKFWFATKLITTGIVYNTKAPFRPTSWADLLKPEAKGLVVMPSPLNSGAALIHAATLTGALPGGWDYYTRLMANGAQVGSANGDVLRAVASGEKLYGMIVDFMPIREKAKGAPVEFVFPAEGVSAVSEPVAILKTASNPVAARAFVDFLLARDGQEMALRQGYIPAHPAVPLPAGYPARAAISLMPFDAGKLLKEQSLVRKTFAEIFQQ